MLNQCYGSMKAAVPTLKSFNVFCLATSDAIKLTYTEAERTSALSGVDVSKLILFINVKYGKMATRTRVADAKR